MIAQQVKEELKEYDRYYSRKRINCVYNAYAFSVFTHMKYNVLNVTGHCINSNSNTIVDATVGAAWIFSSGTDFKKIFSILKNKTPPDVKAKFFDQDALNFWWNYEFKLNEVKKSNPSFLEEHWDVPIMITRHLIQHSKSIKIGKFSDFI